MENEYLTLLDRYKNYIASSSFIPTIIVQQNNNISSSVVETIYHKNNIPTIENKRKYIDIVKEREEKLKENKI